MKEFTGFQRDLIYIIESLGRCKGIEIKDVLEEYHGDVTTSRLYSNLDIIVEEGYVEKGSMDDRTNAYTLTEQGQKALTNHRKWLDRL